MKNGNNGLDISGRKGARIRAAADGEVVYAGSGLRGYGQLLIIQHNDVFLSAYAHNQALLVSEGATVRGGQTVAKMGDTDAESVKILTIGRLIPRKGFQFLIQAIPQMVSRARNPFQIDIVGDGPYRAQLQKMVKDLKIEKYVHFSGSVDYADLPDKYRQADIFALCSSAEGMPLVVLEAMGAGLPIVASKVQGIEDLVAVGQNGALVEPGSIEQITDHLTNLINHPDQRRRMGETSVSRVQRYDWKNIAEAYLQIYQRITQS